MKSTMSLLGAFRLVASVAISFSALTALDYFVFNNKAIVPGASFVDLWLYDYFDVRGRPLSELIPALVNYAIWFVAVLAAGVFARFIAGRASAAKWLLGIMGAVTVVAIYLLLERALDTDGPAWFPFLIIIAPGTLLTWIALSIAGWSGPLIGNGDR